MILDATCKQRTMYTNTQIDATVAENYNQQREFLYNPEHEQVRFKNSY